MLVVKPASFFNGSKATNSDGEADIRGKEHLQKLLDSVLSQFKNVMSMSQRKLDIVSEQKNE